jgi:NAD(P)-dependent dehydrogenase (short-subunit alcohol dehydrogenase family)
VIQIADAYRRALKPFGISVTTIAPGYIDTEKLRAAQQNDLSKKPFLTDVETATFLFQKLLKNKKTHYFPCKNEVDDEIFSTSSLFIIKQNHV